MKRYEELASYWAEKISQGHLRAGDSLDPVRLAKDKHKVSASTVLAAYELLQAQGLVHARRGSGFYVNQLERSAISYVNETPEVPQSVQKRDLIHSVLAAMKKPHTINLGAAVPDERIMPRLMIQKAFQKVISSQGKELLSYEDGAGNQELRRLIAKRMALMNCPVAPEDIVITDGCQQALYLALKKITQPGDSVAIESPVYYGLLQILDGLQLKAVEIPTHPQEGISLDALKLAFENWPIKACIVISIGNNPLGFITSEKHQRALVQLCDEHAVQIIEDDIYGDLHFSPQRPTVCRQFSDKVIYCSSFSKALAPGLRVGWVASRQHAKAITSEKITLHLSSPGITQSAVACLLEEGKYDKHIRKQRVQIAKSMQELLQSIQTHFPAGIEYTHPAGGYVTWLKLPDTCPLTSTELFYQAIKQNVSIVPGVLFSTSNKYEKYIRLSSSGYWSDEKVQAIKILAEIIKGAMEVE